MASGTINGSTGNEYIDAKVVWSSKADTGANTSAVTAALYYLRLNNYTTYGEGSFSITVNGEKTVKTNNITITDDGWVTAMEVTVPVKHDSDGGKSVAISAAGSIPGTTLSSTSVSGVAVLDTIPRASSITSAGNVTLGKACNVKWTHLSKSFRYKLTFELGGWSYTTGVIHPNQTSAYIYDDYPIPMDVAEELPKAKTGSMKVTLYTYSDTAGKNQVGEADSLTFTVTVPDNSNTKPTLTMTLSTVHSLGSAFTGLYIQGRSRVKAAFKASGKYGATIASYKLYVAGKSYGSPYESAHLATAGTVTVKGRATDSRGYYTDIEEEITVLPYSEPKVAPASGESAIVCARCHADGTLAEDGTYLRIRAKRSYSKVTSDGVQKNYCSIRYRYRPESTNTYSNWVTLLARTDTGADTVDSGAIPNVVASTVTTYFVQVGVIDDIGEADALQITVPTDFVTLDIPEEYGGRSIGIFRHAAEPEDGERRIDIDGFIHGGGVDNLTLGTRLTATAEAPISLDDIKTPGCYYSPNAENSVHMANTPYTEGGFGLEVRKLQHKDFIRQTVNYGRTTIWRHYNGSEWSDWVRVMVSTEFDTAATDFVIEHGTKDGWTYKKYKSKTYEMFGEFEVVPGTSTINGTMYRTGSISIPAPFTIASAMVSGTAVGYYWISNGGKSGTDAVNIRIISDKTISASTVTVRLHVVGTYA